MPFQKSLRILDFVMMVPKKTFCPHYNFFKISLKIQIIVHNIPRAQ